MCLATPGFVVTVSATENCGKKQKDRDTPPPVAPATAKPAKKQKVADTQPAVAPATAKPAKKSARRKSAKKSAKKVRCVEIVVPRSLQPTLNPKAYGIQSTEDWTCDDCKDDDRRRETTDESDDDETTTSETTMTTMRTTMRTTGRTQTRKMKHKRISRMMACSICSSKGNNVTRTVFYIVTQSNTQ